MKRSISLLTWLFAVILPGLTACQPDVAAVDWFLGSWISDTELTVQENPHFAEYTPEELAAVRELFGKLRWEVSEYEVNQAHPEIGSYPAVQYAAREVSDGSFRFVTESAGGMLIRRMEQSFCIDFEPLPGTTPFLITECFSRVGE